MFWLKKQFLDTVEVEVNGKVRTSVFVNSVDSNGKVIFDTRYILTVLHGDQMKHMDIMMENGNSTNVLIIAIYIFCRLG